MLAAAGTGGAMAERKKLGDLLKEARLIDDFQLQSALSHQRNWKGKLGSILVELGFVRESELAKVLSEKLRIPHVDLFDPEIPDEIVNLIKADIAKKHGVVPVKVEGRVLTLAVGDPMDMEAMDEVRFITGLAVKPALAMESEIRDAIRKYYDGEPVRHQEAPTIQERVESAPATLEIIHERTEPSPREERSRLDGATVRELMEAVITVLVDKGVLTREELSETLRLRKRGRQGDE